MQATSKSYHFPTWLILPAFPAPPDSKPPRLLRGVSLPPVLAPSALQPYIQSILCRGAGFSVSNSDLITRSCKPSHTYSLHLALGDLALGNLSDWIFYHSPPQFLCSRHSDLADPSKCQPHFHLETWTILPQIFSRFICHFTSTSCFQSPFPTMLTKTGPGGSWPLVLAFLPSIHAMINLLFNYKPTVYYKITDCSLFSS